MAKGPSTGPGTSGGGGGGSVTSTFTAGNIPLATSTTNLGNSLLSQSGTTIVVAASINLGSGKFTVALATGNVVTTGSLAVGTTLTVTGVATFTAATTMGSASSHAQNLLINGYMEILNDAGNSAEIELTTTGGTGSPKQWRVLSLGSVQSAFGASGSFALHNQTDNVTALVISAAGVLTAVNLAGSGTRMVVASATGVISTQSIPAGSSLADPTGTIGLTAVAGVLTSGLRSDGAPALSQAIVPTWTGVHTFTATGSGLSSAIVITAAAPATTWIVSGAASNTKVWDMAFGATTLEFRTRTDAHGAGVSWMTITRSGTTVSTLGLDVANISTSSILTLNGSKIVAGGSGTNGIIGSISVVATASVGGMLSHGPTTSVDTALSISSGLVAVNAALADNFTLLLDANATISNPSNPATGRMIRFRIQQGGSFFTLAWGTAYDFLNATPPPMTGTLNQFAYYAFKWNEISSTWQFVGSAIYADA